MLIEHHGDLFTVLNNDNKTALAHCVSKDLKMGRGIAVKFKQLFGSVNQLLSQNKGVGKVAILEHNDRYIYYLVTKKNYWGKPTYASLRSTLEEMLIHALQNGVSNIAMPRIGCGLDRLQWPKVKDMINDVFDGSNITIEIYYI